PFFASDRTAIINTPLDIKGQVSYQLVRGTTAVEACTTYEAVGNPQIFPVSDITAIPNAAAVQISTPGVYNWIVTFTPDGGGSPIVSGCGAETFIAFAEVERTIKITCTYFPTSKTTSYLVEVPKLTPDAPDYHPGANGLTAVAVPLLLDNTNGSGITYHNYNSSIGANNPRAQFTRQPWRELRVDVVFPDGVTGWAEADCGSSIKLNPTITTTIKNAQGDVIPNGTNLTQLPTQVRDTAVLTGATVDFGGTFTYKLYNGAGCTGTPVINVKTVTNPGQAPDSDLFSLASDGQYRFIVEYSGDAHNSPAVSRCQEEFFSINDGPTPLQPTVTGNECVAGVYQEPTVVITNGNGFTYEVTSQPTMVGNVWYYTVTATLSGDETIGDVAGTGWVKTGDKTATFDGEIAHTPCVVLEPAAPTFEGNVCENDVYTEPMVILPEDENGVIAYALVTAPTSGNDGFYSIRATIEVDGYAWGDLPAGWTIDPQDPTIAVFEGNLPLDLCVEETQPVAPTVDGNECFAGVFVEPSVVVATTPYHILYVVVSQQIVDDTFVFTVSATIIDDHYIFGQLPVGWELDENDSSVAIYEGEVELEPCIPVDLETPEVAGNVCEGGEYSEPSVVEPAGSEYLTYEVIFEDIDYTNNTFTYTVRASIQDDSHGWATPPGEGWTRIDALIAEYTETIELKPCIEVELGTPQVTDNACVDGVFLEPRVILPLDDETQGLTYTIVSAEIDYATATFTYTVRATIVGDGYGWADPPGEGWTEVDSLNAEFTGSVMINECIPVLPGTPYVEGNTCIAGVFTPPTVSATAVQGITYEITQPSAANNWTYTIVATIVDERMGWSVFSNTVWERVDSLNATTSGTVTPNLCEEIDPIAPTVSGNTCIAGVFTPPSVVTATTPTGISYVLTTPPTAGNNWTYTVTATITVNGVEWGDLDGWVETSPTTATYTDTIEANECAPIDPVAPTIADNTCLAGVFSPPRVVVATTPAGINYAVTTAPAAGNNWTYTVTATITIDGVAWGNLTGWTRVNATTATYTRTIEANECEAIAPIAPVFVDNVCIAGVYHPPRVFTSGLPDGISYALTTPPTAGNNWTYTVTATIDIDGVEWGNLTGWIKTSATTATYTFTIEARDCGPVVPVTPTISGNTCLAGVFTPPSVDVATTPAGITYVVTTPPTEANGWTYLVTATIALNGIAWGDFPGGWERVNETTATYEGTIDINECEEIAPVAPTIADNTCIAGVFSPPRVVVATTPAGISYVVTTPPTAGNNWTYTVTATIDIDGVEWGDLSGWVETSPTTATYTRTVEANECEEIAPVAPTISDNTCLAGVFTLPKVDLPSGPAGISYVLTTPPSKENNWTYTITATIDIDGVEWGNLTGWVETSPTVATYTRTIEANECEEIAPVAPIVVDNTCIAGVFTPPRVSMSALPDGISYALTTPPTAGNNWTYTVTATIDVNGVEWGNLTGWIETSATTATYTRTIEVNDCAPIAPVAPTISGNTCLAGVFTPPSVDVATTPAGITYVVTTPPTKANGWTYLVTATIAVNGVAWNAAIEDEGWTIVDSTTATYAGTIEANECEPVAPATPQIEANECVAGVFNPPVVTVAPVTGIRYSIVQPNEENGWQFIVEAEITVDGIEWDDLEGTGWTVISPTLARFNDTVGPNRCEELEPAIPDVSISTCIAGVFTAPVVTVLDERSAFSYAIVQPSAGNNWTFTVTVSIVEDGIGWGDLAGSGWSVTNPTTAVFTAQAEVTECEPVVPLAPVIEGHDCEDGELIPPTIVIGVTPGIEYTIVQPNAGNNWTFTVTATIEGDGKGWGDLTGTGWEIVSPGVATYTFVIDLKDCEEPIDPNAPKPGPKVPVTELPNTGAGHPVSPSLPFAALMLMLAMLALTLATRLVRRQDG
ncbi:MAG: hypothetical protein IT334_00870, partial [Thermomicrobiales bacterium]|nr:hypothetical protein [Thermomicrobiales bacterium]